MKPMLAIALLLTLPAPAVTQASPVKVFAFSQPRATVCQDDDWAFATGTAFQNARAELLNLANFGPSGIVGRSIEFVTDTLITPPALLGVDIVLLSTLPDTLDAIEKATVAEFVSQGGGLFFFGNSAALNLAQSFGGIPGAAGAQCAEVSSAIPPATGPFGAASGCMAANYHLNFQDPGPGAVFLSDGAPVGVTYTHDSGRAILLNDEEWICDMSVTPPCGVSGPNGSRMRLFLNAIAWVAPPESFEFDPALTGVPDAAPTIAWSATPNPFADRTTIRLNADGPVGLTIYDATGRAVRRLDNGGSGARNGTIEWDGLDDSGQRLPSGMYLFRTDPARAGTASQGGRLWLVR